MKRVALRAWLLVLMLLAACCLGQQPPSNASSSGESAAGQASTGQSSAGQSSASQASGTHKPDSEGKSSSNQSSSTQGAPGQGASKNTANQSNTSEVEDEQESSSRETHIDTSPPKDDAKEHPESKAAVGDLEPAPSDSDVQEFHPWNPLKASKDVEVGDYYFRRKNYKAALDRYKEALYYKDNDAIATYRLAVCQEKLGDKGAARGNFEKYLKILPEGPLAKEARAGVDRLGGTGTP